MPEEVVIAKVLGRDGPLGFFGRLLNILNCHDARMHALLAL